MNSDLFVDSENAGDTRISLPVVFIRQLNSTSSIEEILHCIALWLPQIIEADRASICLGRPPSLFENTTPLELPLTHLKLFAFVGKEAIPQNMLIPIKGTQVGRAYEDQTPLRCDDCSKSDTLDGQMLYKAGINSFLNAPLRKDGICFGTLNVGHACKGFYTHQNLIILQCLADWVTTYLFNQMNLDHQKQLALTDPLTGVANRRYYFDKGTQLYGRWRNCKHPYTLAILDVDYFKKINDVFGHDAGDKVLQSLCHHLLKHIRSDDTLARIGGEEFALLLPDTQSDSAHQVIERSRQSIAESQLEHNGEYFSITISAGVSQVHSSDSSFDETMLRADSALYYAKGNGRNRSCINNSPLM